jgi:cytochrome c55X
LNEALSAFGSVLVLALAATGGTAGPLPDQRQAELRDLVLQDCGSCHGMRLTGGLGPALTPAALADRPLTLVTATIRDGRAGTPMPPWSGLLNDAEIDWIAHFLKNGEGTP